MGSFMAKSNVTSGVKEQAAGTKELYKYMNLVGGGELVEMMRKVARSKDYTEVDQRIEEELVRFQYNDGKGKWIHISKLMENRCRERGLKVPKPTANKNGVLKRWPSELELCGEEKDWTDDQIRNKYGVQYKKVCWKLDQMGAVGETALHVCLLNATSIHADLAKRLLMKFPNLINDIYISDEYYGENVLHMAISNEDPSMVKFFLDRGADYHQRFCGNFVTPDDQKDHRKDSYEHDWFDLPTKTNYAGPVYWGEYPLGFAACLGQEECARLLIARGANPNLQDSNGNTVLHCLVVHFNKMAERAASSKHYTSPTEMFDIMVEMGAKLNIKNRQQLTPLTLAAKMARREIYERILEIEREVLWIYGNVTCANYPLNDIDTISETGDINTNSAMYHIVYGGERGHLTMIDGVISHLLHEKWKTFAKARFFRRFMVFCLYFVIFVIAVYLRPGTDTEPEETQREEIIDGEKVIRNVSLKDPCYLMKIRPMHQLKDISRLVLEGLVILGATIYVFLSLKEIYHQGYKIFFQTLMFSPAKALFLVANCFVILVVPGRAACAHEYEDVMTTFSILCTAPYFLFFCRGIKLVGPFVVMIYTMIRTDLMRFFVIYLIFVIGFSQAMFVLFRGVEHNIFSSPWEALMGMFVMSLGEFADIYESFNRSNNSFFPKAIFLVYMVLVTLLLVNMLIAMMAHTYERVNETQKEWLRQWAKIVLVIEQTVTTENRVVQQINYSQPMSDQRRALVIRWHQTEEEQEEIKAHRDEERAKQRQILQRKMEARMEATKNANR